MLIVCACRVLDRVEGYVQKVLISAKKRMQNIRKHHMMIKHVTDLRV
jgi:hypothetical protein